MFRKITTYISTFLLMALNGSCSEWFGDDEIEIVKIKDSVPEIKTMVFSLPLDLAENSGLIFYNDLLWTFNDSGGEPELYGFEPHTGEIRITLLIKDATNIDWEDIAQDKDHILIGDFGNNNGSRKDLRIYRIKKNEINSTPFQEIGSDFIEFYFENQTDFSTRTNAHAFDCEAMITKGDSIYIFTKDWIKKNTVCYSLPTNEETCMAKRLIEYNVNGLVTGSDYDENRNMLVLCGYREYIPFIHFIYNFLANDRENNSSEQFTYFHLIGNQTEGVSFYTGDTIFISSEKNEFDARLFYLVK